MACHLLLIQNQLTGESIFEFLVNLANDKRLHFWSCWCWNLEHIICDAIIKGLDSLSVCQCILENEDITLQWAYNLA